MRKLIDLPRVHKLKTKRGQIRSIPASPVMKLGLFILVLLSSNPQSPCETTEAPSQDRTDAGADHQMSTTGFIVAYTLITANSPDCEHSLVDNFPIRVQYRTTSDGDGEQSNTSVSEWMSSPNVPGSYNATNLYKCNISSAY